MRKKLKSNRGLTMVELLCCVIILLLLSAVCGSAMGLVSANYQRTMFQSDSQHLESMLNLAVGDLLRHAAGVAQDGSGNVTSFSTRTTGSTSSVVVELKLDSKDATNYYLTKTISGTSYPVLGEKVYGDTLSLDSWNVTFDGNVFTIDYVIRGTKANGATRNCTVSFRPINEIVVAPPPAPGG